MEKTINDLRSELHPKIEEAIRQLEGDEETVLLGWALVFETATPHDSLGEPVRPALSLITSNLAGDAEASPWQAKGYLAHVLDDFISLYQDDFLGEDEDD